MCLPRRAALDQQVCGDTETYTGNDKVPRVEELVMMGFGDKHRAVEVLPQLQRLQFAWSAGLHNAVEVDSDGRLRVIHGHLLNPSSGVEDVTR